MRHTLQIQRDVLEALLDLPTGMTIRDLSFWVENDAAMVSVDSADDVEKQMQGLDLVDVIYEETEAGTLHLAGFDVP